MSHVPERNCTNCYYNTFKKCLRGPNGELLDPRDVDQDQHGCDEYDHCSGWKPPKYTPAGKAVREYAEANGTPVYEAEYKEVEPEDLKGLPNWLR